jgi:transmembrane sensor
MSIERSTPGAFDESMDWDGLARYLADESPAEEAERFRLWLEADPRRAELVTALDRSLDGVALEPAADLDVEGALRRVRARMDDAEVIPLSSRRESAARAGAWWRGVPLRAAAAILLVLAAGLLYRQLQRGSPGAAPALAAATYTTAFGERDSVRLPDGSTVLLGPRSELVVAAGYGQAARAVELRGEAFFDVVHDASRLFSVRAGGAEIHDLGTSFVVTTDPGAGVRVVVTSGRVSLAAAGAPAGTGTVLGAGDRALLEGGHAEVERARPVDADLAWTRGRLVFEETPLPEVAVELWRWYGAQLRIADPALRERRLTASFENEPLDSVLDVIRRVVGAEIEMRGDTAVLRAARGPAGR